MKPIYPNKQFKSFCYIKSAVKNPNIIVGDYCYYLKLKWWDKNIETIKKIIPLLSNGTNDLNKLKSYYD